MQDRGPLLDEMNRTLGRVESTLQTVRDRQQNIELSFGPRISRIENQHKILHGIALGLGFAGSAVFGIFKALTYAMFNHGG